VVLWYRPHRLGRLEDMLDVSEVKLSNPDSQCVLNLVAEEFLVALIQVRQGANQTIDSWKAVCCNCD
jgi:hypothetical protein